MLRMLTASLAAVWFILPVHAHDGVKNPAVMKRMQLMKQMGTDLKALAAMARGQTDFDAEQAKKLLAEIAQYSRQSADVFAAEQSDPKSEALPVIWQDFNDFTARAEALTRYAQTAASASQLTAGALKAHVGELGAACKSCHERYKK